MISFRSSVLKAAPLRFWSQSGCASSLPKRRKNWWRCINKKYMELTKVQNDLLTLLKLSEVSIEAITGIMVGLKNSEKLMIEMILYIADNHSNEAQINEKFVEMAMRPQDKWI
jgi:hypothetical protein